MNRKDKPDQNPTKIRHIKTGHRTPPKKSGIRLG
jgi:hypothetical protein